MTHSTEFKRAVYDACIATFGAEECCSFEEAESDKEFDKLCSICAEVCVSQQRDGGTEMSEHEFIEFFI